MSILKRLLPLIVVLALLGPFAVAAPAQAQDVTYGYLWSLDFDFETSFNGKLTIEVGPWENGNLVSVDETSSEIVYCKRVGPVYLNGGDAVFAGGYLRCTLDLATVVWENHGLQIPAIDSYGSMLMETTLLSSGANVAPIFTHPDAAYAIDFSQTWAVTPQQELWNGAGLLQTQFPVSGFVSQTYTSTYGCVWNGPCDATFEVGAAGQIVPTAGDRVQFHTDPTSILIGGDGASTFSGRISDLLIDPGNSVH